MKNYSARCGPNLATVICVINALFFYEDAPVFESADELPDGDTGDIVWVWDGHLKRFRYDGGWQPDGEATEVVSPPIEDHPEPDTNSEHGSNKPEEMDSV